MLSKLADLGHWMTLAALQGFSTAYGAYELCVVSQVLVAEEHEEAL